MQKRFLTLDAMRGCAAIVVVIYHATTLVSPRCADGITCEVPFGYLAVDLFFALSGFVLAKAYDDRLATDMTAVRFMRIRMARLLPIFLAGLILGAAPHLADAARGQGGAKHVGIELLLGSVLFPSPSWTPRALPFALDPPAWSLFFELWVANLLFAVGHRALRGPALLGLLVASLLALVVAQAHFGTLNVGSFWADFIGGAPRVLFSFFLGVGLYRVRDMYRVPAAPSWLLLTTVIATFWPPFAGFGGRLFELAAVIAIYPVAILLGSRAVERRPKIGEMLGNWSYAVYAIHVPLLHLTIHWMAIAGVERAPLVLVGYIAFVLLTAAAVTRGDGLLDPWRRSLALGFAPLKPPSGREKEVT